PRFDRQHRTCAKVTTFLHQCAAFFFLSRRRNFQRKTVLPTEHWDMENILDTDRRADRDVEQLAHVISHKPTLVMTPVQARVFQILNSTQGEPMQEIARRLGYQQPGSLSMIKRRIRDAVARAAEDLPAAA